jgi:CopG family nickel-responsive transcriptional regulator
MKDPLVRFGVAIEGSLLREVDALTRERGCTRSELFRDLSRAEVGRAKVKKGVDAVCTFTLVYDHHVPGLSEKLTELQHQLGDGVRAALHVHLSHDLCLEVVVMRGPADVLQGVADRILAMRGVKHGGIEIIAGVGEAAAVARAAAQVQPHTHTHAHEHAHSHEGAHEHSHTGGYLIEGGTGPSSASARARGGRRATPARTGKSGAPAAPPRRGRTRRV